MPGIRKLFKKSKGEEGQSLVEFALVLLPLLLLLLGIIEFGWLFNGKITITSSAREGARVVAVEKDESLATATILEHVDGSGITIPAGGISFTYGSDAGGNATDVTVGVSGQVEPLVGFFITEPVSMSGRAVMRME